MKITEIETFVVDAGWRPWQFCAVRTDEGITGYGEMSDGRNPYGVIGTVSDYEPILIGQDPLAVEARYWDMYRMSRQAPGGIAARAIAGVELALWDIKGKVARRVPVHSLFGGPVLDNNSRSTGRTADRPALATTKSSALHLWIRGKPSPTSDTR